MLSDACFLVLAGVVVMTSLQMVQNNIQFYQTFTGLDAPMWLATVAVPVGWTLIGLRVIQRSLKTIRVYRRGGSMDRGHLMAG
jgi:TRAP-type C4-dicarboxylate transport system permease small subunit